MEGKIVETEIARIRREIEAEYSAATLGLTGLAITARHDFINRRMERVDALRKELANHVGDEAALKVVIEANNRFVEE